MLVQVMAIFDGGGSILCAAEYQGGKVNFWEARHAVEDVAGGEVAVDNGWAWFDLLAPDEGRNGFGVFPGDTRFD